jgi:hypothetical protein
VGARGRRKKRSNLKNKEESGSRCVKYKRMRGWGCERKKWAEKTKLSSEELRLWENTEQTEESV